MRKFVAPVAIAAGLAGAGLTGAILGGPSLSGAQTAPSTTQPAPSPNSGRPSDPIDTALSKLVANGTITQAQADAVKSALTSEMGNRPFRGRGGPHGAMLGHHLDAAATALGMSTDDLAAELKSGKTLADVAKEKNVDVQKVIDALVADENAEIDQAVKDGKMTQAQADQAKADVTQRVTDLVNNGRPGPMGPGGPGMGRHGWHDDDGTNGGSASGGSTTPTQPSSLTS